MPQQLKIAYDLRWQEEEPNNLEENKNCMCVKFSSKDRTGFMNIQCDAKKGYFCQKTDKKFESLNETKEMERTLYIDIKRTVQELKVRLNKIREDLLAMYLDCFF